MKARLWLVALLALLSTQAFAATWYVRPAAGGPYGSANGQSYANAWSGFTNVDYTGMSGSDTLKVCGAFVAADKDTRGGGSAMIYANVSVTITIDGDCSSSGSLSQATLNGASTIIYGVYCDTIVQCQSQTWKNIKVSNFTTRGFYIKNANDYSDVVTFTGTNLDCDDILSAAASGQWCIAGYGNGATFTGINSLRTTDDSIHWEGSNFSVTDSVFMFPGYGTATGVFIGDCVQNITETDNAYIHNNYCDKRNANVDGNVAKSCWVIGDPATGTSGEISDNICYLPTTGNSVFESKPILVSTSVTGVKILRNYIYGGYYGIFSFQSGGTIVGNIVSHTEAEGISVPTTTAGGTHLVANNTVDTSNICYILKGASGAATITAYNNLAMNCTTYGFEKVTATYTQSNNRCDTVTPTCSNNAGTITPVTPALIGGANPTTPDGYRLSSSSVLRRAGKDLNIGNYFDNGGRTFLHPPSIGAWEATSGDAAATRLAR